MSLKIKTKLRYGIGLLFAMIVLLGGLSVKNISDMSADTRNILADNYNSLLYSRRMLDALERIDSDPSAQADFEKNLGLQKKNITEVDENVATSHLVAQYEQLAKERNEENIRRVRLALNQVMSLNMASIYRKSQVAESTSQKALFWIWGIGLSCMVVAFAFLIRFPRSINTPIRMLMDGIMEIANHNYEKRLDLAKYDEFEGVAKSFNRMAERLTEYRKSTLADIIQGKKYIEAIVNSITEPIIGLELLRKEHFSAWRINWRNKADNIRELSEELNIGLDSLVFVDDNPTERELVRQMLPMVEVPEFPKQSYMLPDFLISLSDRYFRVYSVTEEDRRKTEQYKANASRTQERKKFVDFDQYLQSLEIEMRIEPMNSFNVSRIAQMTQKTNQFNLTTRRCSESDLMGFSSEGWLIYCLSVKDRFGDNGITGAVLLRPIDGGYEIDSFLLSCRILGKGIEEAFLSGILNILRNRSVKLVKASYIPTAKNMQVSGFYERTDFVLDSQDKDGSKFYHLNMGAEIKIPSYYKITY